MCDCVYFLLRTSKITINKRLNGFIVNNVLLQFNNCQFNALTYSIWKLEHNSLKRRYIFPKSLSGVSADPSEQLGAKNSILPKNDLRSFCTNMTTYCVDFCDFVLVGDL